MSICIRDCTNALQSDRIFLGFYETCKTAATTFRDYPSNIPIHVKCQSRQATTGDLNDWIQELASALTTDQDTFGKELFAECKEQALRMKITCLFFLECVVLSLTKKWKNTTSIYSGTSLKKLQVFEKTLSITATRNSKLSTFSFGR